MPSLSIFVFFRDKPKTTETTILTLHRRLGYIGPQALKYISTDYSVTVKESGSAIEEYEIYSLLKIY